MVNELVTHMTRASAPAPSVETILHALLPHKYVDHTHADAVLAVTNTADGEQRIAEIYGDTVVVIPYVMPGFDLARLCAELFPRHAGRNTIGMVLMKHGIFSFGATARESYERMIELVDRAERYLAKHNAWNLRHATHGRAQAGTADRHRRACGTRLSQTAGFPMVVQTHTDARTLSFTARADLADVSQQGPATPDHVIRTKRVPMVGRDVDGLRAGLPDLFRRARAAGQGSQDHARPGAARRARPRARPVHRRAHGQGRRHRRRPLPAHHGRDRARDAARRLPGAAGARHLRRRVLGPRAGQAAQGGASRRCSPARSRSSPAPRPASARPASTRCWRAARRWSGSIWIPRVESLHKRADYLGVRCDVTSPEAIVERARSGACAPSAASTC